eukprot:gene25800-31566_t
MAMLHDTSLMREWAGLLAASILGTVMAFHTEARRRRLFLNRPQQRQRWRNQQQQQCLDAEDTHTPSSRAGSDGVVRLPMTLHFVDSALEEKFQVFSADSMSTRQLWWGLVSLAGGLLVMLMSGMGPACGIGYEINAGLVVLHAAGAIIAINPHLHELHLKYICMLVMWLSQCMTLWYEVYDVQVRLLEVFNSILFFTHAELFTSFMPWYHITICSIVQLAVRPGWLLISLSSHQAYGQAHQVGHAVGDLLETWGTHFCTHASILLLHSKVVFDSERSRRDAFIEAYAGEGETCGTNPVTAGERPSQKLQMYGWEMHFARHSWEDAFWQENARLNRAAIPAVRAMHVCILIGSLLVMEDVSRCAYVEFSVLTLSAIGVAFLARSSRVPDRWFSAIAVLQCNVLYPGIAVLSTVRHPAGSAALHGFAFNVGCMVLSNGLMLQM